MKHELRFKLTNPLNPLDSETQTFGCRHTNPDICGSCFLEGTCAFVTEDNVCRKPSKAWGRCFQKLRSESIVTTAEEKNE